jgi:hypothetical protein
MARMRVKGAITRRFLRAMAPKVSGVNKLMALFLLDCLFECYFKKFLISLLSK